ncbi:antibiotic biosynthesis monooxygenase [Aeromicrobium sp. YIM 150415]|uniref:antibiotic biosynthesis monooxygenase n=1 Tax=Aeromicrobium sp. YIM 150415 TaxID=2803912 RepID=UPI00196656A0|nr:antibiotic biosynthesis monooxygenase [Aeromicrobium sp. YIM 150415]MBM9461862.1 antibiotic biosynthesis monooxygenase [Aeromicrobium sp. YIM 150415]
MSDDPITFINIIDVDPSKQQEVVDLLTEGAEKVVSHRPGFLSLTILASADRSRVVNIARWENAESARATQADPAAARYAERTATLGTPSPGVYSVVAEID